MNESLNHFSQFISVKVKKNLRKSEAQFREKLRKLRLRQNNGFLIKKRVFINSGLKTKANAGAVIALSPNVKFIGIGNILEGRILYVRLILHGIKISFLLMHQLKLMMNQASSHFSILSANQCEMSKGSILVLIFLMDLIRT